MCSTGTNFVAELAVWVKSDPYLNVTVKLCLQSCGYGKLKSNRRAQIHIGLEDALVGPEDIVQ